MFARESGIYVIRIGARICIYEQSFIFQHKLYMYVGFCSNDSCLGNKCVDVHNTENAASGACKVRSPSKTKFYDFGELFSGSLCVIQ